MCIRDSNKIVKTILIVLIVLFGAPIAIPVALAVVGTVFAVIVSIAAAIFAILISGLAVAFAGVVVFGCGLTQIIHSAPLALGLLGAGLILAAVGAALTIIMGWIIAVSYTHLDVYKRQLLEDKKTYGVD